MNSIKILFLGDVVGQAGLRALFFEAPALVKEYKADFFIVNGENAADGFGITIENAEQMFKAGVDIITSGNHIWQQEDFMPYLEKSDRVLRPLNYPAPAPGRGVAIVEKHGVKVAVLNVQGRVRMPVITDCPFKTTAEALKKVRVETPIIVIDFHAEDTIEKETFAWKFDGAASIIGGTHTHTQTMDERIMERGTAYLGDLGMIGAVESVIGGDRRISIERALTGVPLRPTPAEGPAIICGLCAEIDVATGKALSIIRVNKRV